MEIDVSNNYDELSQKANAIVINEIEHKKDALICASTGSTPTKTYELVVQEYLKRPGLFTKLCILKLDEWGGISMDHSQTCESYVQKHLIKPLQIPKSRYISFLSNPKNPDLECSRIQNELETKGPIDICILGLGMNGHIALNEPAQYLSPHCHKATLSDISLKHPMAISMVTKPTYGLTLGMVDIMHSKKIIMLINGAHKHKIFKEFISAKISTKIPASLLWLHQNVVCLIDEDAMNG